MTELPSHLMIVRVRVQPAVEKEWNHWYDTVHLPEILACRGFEAARRYLSDGPNGREYITVYRLSGPEAMDGEEFNRRRGWYDFAPYVTASVTLFRATDSAGTGLGEMVS